MSLTTDVTARANLDDDQWRAYKALSALDVAGHFAVLYRVAMAQPRIVCACIEQMERVG